LKRYSKSTIRSIQIDQLADHNAYKADDAPTIACGWLNDESQVEPAAPTEPVDNFHLSDFYRKVKPRFGQVWKDFLPKSRD